MKKTIKIAEVLFVCLVWLGLSLISWLQPDKDISVSERRPLGQRPELSAQTVLNGSFMTNFDTYTLDQFPWRDSFRGLKAMSNFGLFQKLDNNDIYIVDGSAAKLDFPMNSASVENAANKLNKLYEMYLKDTDANLYFSIVPDKGYYLAETNGYPAMDYAALEDFFTEHLDFAQYVDIFHTLSAKDYYATDSHWKQEHLWNTAQTLAEAMGFTLDATYEKVNATDAFYGVYSGQVALPLSPDSITYLTNAELDAWTVYNVETGKTTGIYNLEKLQSNDPYEVFLSGASPILFLENPTGTTGKELIVFRDSFGSSIIPFLTEGYDKITVLDTRYVMPEFLANFVDFSAAHDVLFLYSTTVLNSSGTMK